jgi:hypothetical protein
LSIDAFVEAPMTVKALTRARPTMSADAVAAVRRGLRRAFSRARWPVVPQMRGRTAPTTRTNGRAARAERDRREHERHRAEPDERRGVAAVVGEAASDERSRREHGQGGAGDGAASQRLLHRDVVVAHRRDRGRPGSARAGRYGREQRHHDTDGERPARPWPRRAPGCRRA